MKDEWETYPGGTVEGHWIDLEIRPAGDQPRRERPPSYRAHVKWDGCIHLNHYYNGIDPETDPAERVSEESDYTHICDLAAHIAMLQDLLAAAKKHFGESWPR